MASHVTDLLVEISQSQEFLIRLRQQIESDEERSHALQYGPHLHDQIVKMIPHLPYETAETALEFMGYMLSILVTQRARWGAMEEIANENLIISLHEQKTNNISSYQYKLQITGHAGTISVLEGDVKGSAEDALRAWEVTASNLTDEYMHILHKNLAGRQALIPIPETTT